MKKKVHLLKAVAWVLTFMMILPMIPENIMDVSAATIAESYDYKIKVKNSGVKKAGTDSDIFCVVLCWDGAKHVVKIDSGANDFEKNDCREYNVNLNCQPWEIKEIGLRNGGKDGAHFAWFEWKMPNGTVIKRDVNDWFEKQGDKVYERTYYVWSDTDRQINTKDNFDKDFSGTKYFAPTTNSGQKDIVMAWSGKVTDQYFSEYNFFNYAGATDITFSPSGTSYGYGGISSVSGLEDNSLAKVDQTNGYDSKMTIYTNRLLDYMQRNEIYKLDIKSTIDYLMTDQDAYYSQNYTIYRTGFKLENASVVTAAYVPRKDYNFFNSDAKYKTFEIKIPVKEMNNYSASDIAASLAANMKSGTSKTKIYYDKKEKGKYITPKNVYSSGRYIYVTCDVPADYPNNDNVGITVAIENAKATYSGQTYTLYTRGSTNSNYEYYISTHKVDTKGLMQTVKDDAGNNINIQTGFDTYKQEHKFRIAFDNNGIFTDDGKGGRVEGSFSYKLYTKDGKSEIELKKHNGLAKTSSVPYTGADTNYSVSPTKKTEGEYKLKITSKDLANNLSVTELPVKIDSLAPRVTYTVKTVSPIDGSKRNEYSFKIDDVSESGKLYYVFVEDGNAVPSTSVTKPSTSGPETTEYGKWGFIDQKNSDAQTIVLNLAKDEYFKGRLYWYAVDGAGNDTRIEKNGKVDGNGYYYTDIVLDNETVDCEIVLDDITPGKPQYDISFDTDKDNKVEYRWIGQMQTPKFVYREGINPGDAEHKDGSGNYFVLDGDYTLEYIVTTRSGVQKSYKKEFIYDNSNPSITFEDLTLQISDTRRMNIIVEDIANIETITYELCDAEGNAIGEETTLPAGLPKVSNEVILSPEKTGAYTVKVKATDTNGQTSENVSNPFSVRVAAPEIEIEHNIGKKAFDLPVTNSQDYVLYIKVSEAVEDIYRFAGEQVLQYRISGDGINYSDWTIVGGEQVKQNLAGLEAEVTVKSPVALNDGENRIFVQAVITDKGADPSKIRGEFVAVNSETVICYDAQPPQYKLDIDNDGMTNENILATLSFTDNYSSAGNITFKNNTNYASTTVNSVTDSMQVIDATFAYNTDEGSHFLLCDEAGNSVEIPINISTIDKMPPQINYQESRAKYSGERQDYTVKVLVDEAIESETEFTLIKGDYGSEPDSSGNPQGQMPYFDPKDLTDDIFGPTPDNEALEITNVTTYEEYENGEKMTEYEIRVYADEEILPGEEYEEGTYEYYEQWDKLNKTGYALVAKSSDALKNETRHAVGYGMWVTNRTAEISEVYCSPQNAGKYSVLTSYMSVPVYAAPESMVIPAAVKAAEDGRLDNSQNADIAEFSEELSEMASHYSEQINTMISSLGQKSIYFTDERGRVYKQTITVKDLSEYDESQEFEPLTVYVSFGNEPPVEFSLFKSPLDADRSEWEEMDIENVKALNMSGDIEYHLVIKGENDTVVLAEDFVSSHNYWSDFEMDYNNSVYEDGKGYTELVYTVGDTPNTTKIAAIKVNYNNQGVEEESGFVASLNLLDATPPMTDVKYSEQGYTKNDVTVTLTASDPDIAQNPDSKDKNPAGSDPQAGELVKNKSYSVEELAEFAGIESIEFSEIVPEDPWNYDELTFGDKQKASSASITFTENGYAAARVTNALGLISYVDIEVGNINKHALEEGVHYNTSFVYKNSEGEEKAVEENGYYKEVIAKIEITDEGKEREVEVVNNLGAMEKKLTSFDNTAVFRLRDMYGHEGEYSVTFGRFDDVGPNVEAELDTTAKTNKPIGVTLSAYDMLSSVSSVSLTSPKGETIETVAAGEDTGEGGIVTKKFKATISESGFYKMSAKDINGNETHKNFMVSNIDTTVPQVIEKKATSIAPTRQSVGVKLYYSEPGVTITRVELNDGSALKEEDVIVNYTDSTVRFDENGTVSVWFTDPYGNEGSDVVSVGNINRTPPALEAVVTTSEDELSADVTFNKKAEEKRELSEIFVLHGGVTPMITELDDEGNIISERVANASEVTFTFTDNGTYTFYAFDSIGNIQEIPVEITGIDKKAPVITEVRWSYTYLGVDGKEVEVTHKLTPGEEIGYNIVEDAVYKATNKDITATVITDDPTKFAGSSSKTYSTENSIVYGEDGWFNFNLEKRNKLMDSYGLGLYLIDKQPPVIEGVEDMIFFENPNANDTPYNKNMLTYSAYDERYDEKTDLTADVKIDWGGFNADDITKNTFDKNKPYTITYSVKDKVGNETVVKRKITLIGLFDTMIRINGKYPDSSNRAEVLGNSVEIGLDNFGGTAYARYEKGIYSMGEMKYKGTVITPEGGSFKVDKLSEGWYTFYVQTDLKDYFCVSVYVYNK